MSYQHKPGNVKAKEREERKRRQEAKLQRISKIQKFFTPAASATNTDSLPLTNSTEHVNAEPESLLNTPDATTAEINNSDVCLSGVDESLNTEVELNHESDETHVSQTERQSFAVMNCDIGLWPNGKLPDNFVEYWVERGGHDCQHIDANFSKSIQDDGKQKRWFCRSLFSRTHSLNGEKIPRSWLCYSPATGRAFCFTCKLLSCPDNNAFAGIGYCDWKNAVYRMERHENGQSHRAATLAMFNRSDAKNRVDNKLLEQQKAEVAYSSAVLERVVAVIKHLAERGLSFRGHDELLGSVHNGNYLGTLELLAQFDPFIAAHIEKYGGKGKGSMSFISSTICNEMIDIMGEKVRKFIIDQVKETKYFSLTIDSTPDISHVDRLACVLRYVLEDGRVERFIQFLDMKGHTAEEMLKSVSGFFEKEGINIENCRGQSYDNASNMSGKYGGLQALIRGKNKLTDWVPCFANSLNLVGHCAVDCVPGVKRLPVVKCLCDTRWSAHSASTSA